MGFEDEDEEGFFRFDGRFVKGLFATLGDLRCVLSDMVMER